MTSKKIDKINTIKKDKGEAVIVHPNIPPKLPKVKKPNRRDRKRPALKKRFLKLLLDPKVLGNVSTAADILGIDRTTPYLWEKKDKKFAKDWEAQQDLADNLLADRAENALLTALDNANPTIIIFTLKNRRPDKWRDRYEHTGEDGGPIEQTVALSPEFAAALAEFYGKRNKDSKHRPAKQ